MVVQRTLGSLRGWVLIDLVWVSVSQVRAVTPLAVLLHLGSCLRYLFRKRAIRLLSWGGFNALSGSTGMLNNSWEAYSTPSCMIALHTPRAISFA